MEPPALLRYLSPDNSIEEIRMLRILAVLGLVLGLSGTVWGDSIRLEDLSLDGIRQEWGKPQADKSVLGTPISIGGASFDHGVGGHANFVWVIDLGGNGQRFTAKVGIDDDVKTDEDSRRARVQFSVLGDHTALYSSGWMHAGDAAKNIDIDVRGVRFLILKASARGSIDFDHADWGDAQITFTGKAPVTVAAPVEKDEVLTPPPPPTPRINGARVLGVRPGHPVLYTIAATGQRPMTFSAENLPEGLSLDPDSGRITGNVSKGGEYVIRLKAANALGNAQRDLKLKVGDKIALTPPMGWNSWNCFAQAVSDKKVRAAADAMVNSGLINHGWTYINIDDCWEVRASEPADQRRAADGHILTNAKFPDMKALADYVHSKGLRVGLYSSPGPETCGGFTASYEHEEKDAEQYAAWGFDYLKYDWCSYGRIADKIKAQTNPPSQLDIFRAPYLVMRDALLRQDRDIFFSFCQYGMGDVWEWGAAAGGNCWRTTGDITDTWDSMSSNGFSSAGHEKYAGPGHWNDPDMLVVGMVGWGPALHKTRLTPNEQYTHISLWCLLSSPLLIGCDMTQLDDFTKGLLTNDEVLAVNQDPLGRQAGRVSQDLDSEIWAKKLADGGMAVGLFNRGELPETVQVRWGQLGLSGKQAVRDLWRQKDLGVFEDGFQAEVPRHGVVLVKITGG
jgi:alpha-galactosidase